MTASAAAPGYVELARASLAAFTGELARHGIEIDPALAFEVSTGVVSYYDKSRVLISIAAPGVDGPGAALQRLYLRTLLGFGRQEDLDDLVRLCIPLTVGHELGHHLRHHYGRFGDDLWLEEQVANQLATALQKRRFTPAERGRAVELLGHAMEHLAPEINSQDAAVASYGSLLTALNVAGVISSATRSSLALIQKYVPSGSGGAEQLLPVDVLRRLEHRDDLRRSFGETYSADIVRYVYYQLGWLFIALSSPETLFVDAIAREHLGVALKLVPPPLPDARPPDAVVRALYAALRHLPDRASAGATYFRRRYEGSVLALLSGSVRPEDRRVSDALRNLSSASLESQGPTTDPFDLVAPLLGPDRRALLPAALEAEPRGDVAGILAALTDATDRRLFAHVALAEGDAPAATTLERLRVLWNVRLFAGLPPEAVVPLAENMSVLHASAGQTIVWEGDDDQDIYCVHAGAVAVLDASGARLGVIGPGEVFGELQYLLRRGRSKTIRATEASTLLAIPEHELSFLAYRHPEVGLQIARAVAERLAERTR